jgi:hypothetical protein
MIDEFMHLSKNLRDNLMKGRKEKREREKERWQKRVDDKRS